MAVSAVALVAALVLGIIVGTAAATGPRAARVAAAVYVEGARNIPLLIHMYFWYMALAFLRLPAFTCAVLGLALSSPVRVTGSDAGVGVNLGNGSSYSFSNNKFEAKKLTMLVLSMSSHSQAASERRIVPYAGWNQVGVVGRF